MPLKLITVIFLLLYTKYTYCQTITHNQTGSNNGFFYSFWNDHTRGSATMVLQGNGRYTVTWDSIGNFTAGKGWAMGNEHRYVCYAGKFNGGSNGFLALYGWTKDSLVEYYVVENYGEWVPPGASSIGTFKSDGGTYNIYKTLRLNKPSIMGTATFYQYWSVRKTKRTSGTVTFANHVKAWKSKGMHLGKIWDYQIMETEGNNSSGNADIKVSECALKVNIK